MVSIPVVVLEVPPNTEEVAPSAVFWKPDNTDDMSPETSFIEPPPIKLERVLNVVTLPPLLGLRLSRPIVLLLPPAIDELILFTLLSCPDRTAAFSAWALFCWPAPTKADDPDATLPPPAMTADVEPDAVLP